MHTTVGRWGWGAGISACCLSMAIGTVMAQQKGPATPPAGAPGTGAVAPPAMSMDAEFAACLVLENQNEIAAAKLAEDRTESGQVKKFARMLQTDHEKFIGELERFGGQQYRNRVKDQIDSRSEDQRSETEAQANQQKEAYGKTGTQRSNAPGTATAAGAAAPHSTHLQIRQEVADECLTSTRRELSDKKGSAFDACYVGMQIAGHLRMVDELKVLERHASRELQPVLKQGRTKAEEHLQKAKELMKELEKEQEAHTAQRSNSK